MKQKSVNRHLKRLQFGVVLFLFVALPGSLHGQRTGGVVLNTLTLVTDLLEFEEVQKELEMNADQIKTIASKAKTLARELKDEMREALITGTNFDEFRDDYIQRDDHVFRLLNEAQQSRLQQLHWQRLGIRFWADQKVLAALKPTEEQQAEMEVFRLETLQKAQKMAESGELFRDGPDRVAEKLLALNQENETNIRRLLTAEQLQKVEELRGKAFTFPERMNNSK